MSDPTPTISPAVAPPQPRRAPLYHVLLFNDDDHTYDYVIEMLGKLFRIQALEAFKLAQEVDLRGKAVVHTTLLEQAEFKRDQIHAFGADWRIEECRGSMSAEIEPASDA
jgi:ATP-dependent Clp protease adaptor protein ClpS